MDVSLKETRIKWAKRIAQGSEQTFEGKEGKADVVIYGGVKLDSDEIAAATLSPKFLQYPELSKDELVLQQNVCDTKIRWKRRGDLIDSKGHVIPKEQDTSPEDRITEHEYHEVYNSETKTLDFTKLRCTDVKNNPRVKLADPRPPIEEAHLTTRNSMVTQKFLKYVETHPHSQNLTPAEKRGIRKLRKRQSEGDLVIWLTDKSGKICVSGLDVYERCGDGEVPQELGKPKNLRAWIVH